MQRHLLERHDCILGGWEASLKYLFNAFKVDRSWTKATKYTCVCNLYDHIVTVLFSKLETMSHTSHNDIRRLVWEPSCQRSYQDSCSRAVLTVCWENYEERGSADAT